MAAAIGTSSCERAAAIGGLSPAGQCLVLVLLNCGPVPLPKLAALLGWPESGTLFAGAPATGSSLLERTLHEAEDAGWVAVDWTKRSVAPRLPDDQPEQSKIVAPPRDPPGLIDLWNRAPRQARERSSRKQCCDEWKAQKLERISGEVVAALEKWKASEKWRDQGGKFIEGLHRWLKNRKWMEAPDEPGASNGNGQARHKRNIGYERDATLKL
jgi:hypothetical protein